MFVSGLSKVPRLSCHFFRSRENVMSSKENHILYGYGYTLLISWRCKKSNNGSWEGVSTHAGLFTACVLLSPPRRACACYFRLSFPMSRFSNALSRVSATYCKSIQSAKAFKTAVAYPVKQFSPALHGDTLEDGEDREKDVVKLGDSIVWSQPVLSTHSALWTQPWRSVFPARKLLSDLA